MKKPCDVNHKLDLKNIFNLPDFFNMPSLSFNMNSVNSENNKGSQIANDKENSKTKQTKKKDKGLTIKYIGCIEGQLGIGTKKVNSFLNPLVPQIHIAITPNIQKEEKSLFNLKNKSKVLYKSNTCKSDNHEEENCYKKSFYNTTSKSKFRITTKDLIMSKTTIFEKNMKSLQDNDNIKALHAGEHIITTKENCVSNINLNNGFIDNINYEFDILNKTGKIGIIQEKEKEHVSNPHERPMSTSEKSKNLPFIFKQMMHKDIHFSKSELINPNRYRKPKINIEELLSHHNAMSRRDMSGTKITDYHLKCAFGVKKLSERVKSGIKLKSENQKNSKSLNIINITNYKSF